MTGRTWDGLPLAPGVNVDAINYDAGLARARSCGFTSPQDLMVTQYALQRHARGEELGAEWTWLSEFPHDLTSWRMILATAMGADDRNTVPTSRDVP